jgi:hypothetical protein
VVCDDGNCRGPFTATRYAIRRRDDSRQDQALAEHRDTVTQALLAFRRTYVLPPMRRIYSCRRFVLQRLWNPDYKAACADECNGGAK